MNSGGDELSFRHELKYLISERDRELIGFRLGTLMRMDAHARDKGYYKIRSLYFDDYWGSAYEDKIMGVPNRRKYRIRVYDDRDGFISLERKLKCDRYIAKQSATLTRREAEQLISGDYEFLLQSDQPLCREFYYECRTKLMKPRVIVDYERVPYAYYAGDVRITFDYDVRAALLRFDLFDSDLPSLRVLDPGKLIMEVKYTGFMPNLLKKALPGKACEMEAVSKYVLACDRTQFLSVYNQ